MSNYNLVDRYIYHCLLSLSSTAVKENNSYSTIGVGGGPRIMVFDVIVMRLFNRVCRDYDTEAQLMFQPPSPYYPFFVIIIIITTTIIIIAVVVVEG